VEISYRFLNKIYCGLTIGASFEGENANYHRVNVLPRSGLEKQARA
jgi:hypothetical protein